MPEEPNNHHLPPDSRMEIIELGDAYYSPGNPNRSESVIISSERPLTIQFIHPVNLNRVVMTGDLKDVTIIGRLRIFRDGHNDQPHILAIGINDDGCDVNFDSVFIDEVEIKTGTEETKITGIELWRVIGPQAVQMRRNRDGLIEQRITYDNQGRPTHLPWPSETFMGSLASDEIDALVRNLGEEERGRFWYHQNHSSFEYWNGHEVREFHVCAPTRTDDEFHSYRDAENEYEGEDRRVPGRHLIRIQEDAFRDLQRRRDEIGDSATYSDALRNILQEERVADMERIRDNVRSSYVGPLRPAIQMEVGDLTILEERNLMTNDNETDIEIEQLFSIPGGLCDINRIIVVGELENIKFKARHGNDGEEFINTHGVTTENGWEYDQRGIEVIHDVDAIIVNIGIGGRYAIRKIIVTNAAFTHLRNQNDEDPDENDDDDYDDEEYGIDIRDDVIEDGDDEATVPEVNPLSNMERMERLRHEVENISRNIPNEAIMVDPLSQQAYRRSHYIIHFDDPNVNVSGVRSEVASFMVPTGIDFQFTPEKKPLFRISVNTPTPGWKARMMIRMDVFDATRNFLKARIFEGKYEDYLDPQCDEDDHYRIVDGQLPRAMAGDVISISIESPDVINVDKTRFRAQCFILTTLGKGGKPCH